MKSPPITFLSFACHIGTRVILCSSSFETPQYGGNGEVGVSSTSREAEVVYIESMDFVLLGSSVSDLEQPSSPRARRRIRRKRKRVKQMEVLDAHRVSQFPLSEEHCKTEFAYNEPYRIGREPCGRANFPNMSARRFRLLQEIIKSVPGRLTTQGVVNAVIARLRPKRRRLFRGFTYLSRLDADPWAELFISNSERVRVEVWWSEDEEYNDVVLPKRKSPSIGGPTRPKTYKYQYPLRDYTTDTFWNGLKYQLFGLKTDKEKIVTMIIDAGVEEAEKLALPQRKDGRRVCTNEWREYVSKYDVNDRFDIPLIHRDIL